MTLNHYLYYYIWNKLTIIFIFIKGSKIIFIETFANINTKTATGRLVYKFADKFIVQWDSMKDIYPNAIDGGWIFWF